MKINLACVLLVLLAGCSLWPKEEWLPGYKPPTPPIAPPAAPSPARRIASGVPLLAPPPQPILLVWDYPSQLLAGVVFEVWHTTNLTQPFTQWTNVSETQVPIGGQPQEFFKVRARDLVTGQTSDWAHIPWL